MIETKKDSYGTNGERPLLLLVATVTENMVQIRITHSHINTFEKMDRSSFNNTEQGTKKFSIYAIKITYP